METGHEASQGREKCVFKKTKGICNLPGPLSHKKRKGNKPLPLLTFALSGPGWGAGRAAQRPLQALLGFLVHHLEDRMGGRQGRWQHSVPVTSDPNTEG